MTQASAQAFERVLTCDAINNFRDFGGWRTQDGGRVKTGRLFRSAHHARASAADAEQVRALGITVVTDLRHPSEQEEQPSAWLGTLPITVIEEPAVDEVTPGKAPHIQAFESSDFSFAAVRRFMVDHYGQMPYDTRLIALYRRYFQALDERDGVMLIHCAAGKDRTGILAALTHHVLGVHPDDLLEDYLMTNTAANMDERLPHIRRRMEALYGRPLAEESLRAMLGVVPEYLDQTWRTLAERSGSIDTYLADALGVDRARADRIRARLLA